MKTLRFYGTLLMAVLFASLVACSESSDSEEPDTTGKPDTPVSGNTTVDEKGGSFTVDELTIKIPSGAYAEKKSLTINKAKKGSVVSGDEISDCYSLKFDGSTHKPIRIGIKADKGTDVRLAVLSKGYAQSNGQLTPIESVSLLKTTYSNGTYIAQLPAIAMDEAIAAVGDAAANESTEIKMTVALVDVGNDTAGSRQDAQTRAGRGYALFDLIWIPNSKKDFDHDALLREDIIPEVLKKLDNLGFKVPEGEIVPIIMREFSGDDATKWGMYEMSRTTTALDKVSINTRYFQGTLSESDLQQLKATMIHEIQHYFQGIGYDDTTAPMRFLYNWFGSSQWQLIDEASAVWSEKFYVKASAENKNNDLTVGHGAEATINLIPGVAFTSYHKSEHTDELGLTVGGGTAFYRCGDRGYGLSLFVHYLAKMYGDNTPVHLFEARKNGSKTVEDCFKSYGASVGDDVLSTAALHDFMSEACRGKVYLRSLVNFEYFYLAHHTAVGSLWNNFLMTDKPSVSKSFKLPKYGTLVHKYLLGGAYLSKNGLESFEGKHVEVTQESEDVSTEVWLVTGEDWGGAKLLGTTTGGKIVEYKDVEKLLSKGGKSETTIYTISVPLRKEVVSGKLKCEVKDGGMISVDEDYLVFGADEETQQVKATSDQPKFTAKANADWLTVKTAKGGIVEITATKNSSSADREGTVSVIALDSNGKEVAKTTVTCHQLGREGGEDEDDFYIYAQLYVHLNCTLNLLSKSGDYIKANYPLQWMTSLSNGSGMQSTKDNSGTHFSRTEKYTIDDTEYESTFSFSVSGLDGHSSGGASISNVKSVHKETSSTKEVMYELEIGGGFQFAGYSDIMESSAYEIKGEDVKPSLLKFKETINGKTNREYYELNPVDDNVVSMSIIYRKFSND